MNCALIIAGPCSAETEQQVLFTAKALASAGIKYFRAGLWKPRTQPGSFEGVGEIGLQWLRRVKIETGMAVFCNNSKSDSRLREYPLSEGPGKPCLFHLSIHND